MKKIKFTSIEVEAVSRNPDIKKRMMITAREFGNTMSFVRAVFAPSQSTSSFVKFVSVKLLMLLSVY